MIRKAMIASLASFALLALVATGCGGDGNQTDGGVDVRRDMGGGDDVRPDTRPDGGTGDDMGGDVPGDMTGDGFPAPPTLGAQVDRLGRPGINTALTDPFYNPEDAADEEAHRKTQDAYNANGDRSTWNQYIPGFQAMLAIYDALDANCGNQLAANPQANDASRYQLLATALADDRLYVNAASGTCQTFLAVEANQLGIKNDDCGGRTPLYDVIDVVYSALAAGATSGVSDGVNTPDKGASDDAFPWLAAPIK